MHRFPDGIGEEDFFHKDVPEYFPQWITRLSLEKKEGGTVTHLICQNRATLAYLANQACITPHVWLSRKDRLDYPDRMIFDLDPPDGDFDPVRLAARRLKDLLEELGMAPFLMATGSRGLHVVVPLDRGATFDQVRTFAQQVADLLTTEEPERLTTEHRKNQRQGRIFVDVLRNAYAQTTPPPYAVRARAGAPIATPLDWSELPDGSLHPAKYTIHNIFRRLGQKAEPWKGMSRHARSLSQPRRRLEALLEGSHG
jgi:bifunctional non-homologous end joining protein LigD